MRSGSLPFAHSKSGRYALRSHLRPVASSRTIPFTVVAATMAISPTVNQEPACITASFLMTISLVRTGNPHFLYAIFA